MDGEFGEGLLDDAGAIGRDAPDPFLEEARTLFEGLPENLSKEDFRDYVLTLQTQADEAKAQLSQYESQLAQQMAAGRGQETAQDSQAAAAAAEAQAQGASKAEARRVYEAASQMDPMLQPYVGGQFSELDANGMYQPTDKYRLTPTVLQACQAMNATLEHQRRVLQDFTRDPYSVASELIPHTPFAKQMQERYEALQKQLEAQQKAFEEQLSPIQRQQQESALDQLVQSHHSLLVSPPVPGQPPKWSPAGETFNLMINGDEARGIPKTDPQVALAYVKQMQSMMAPAPAPKPQRKPAQPPTVIQQLRQRMSNGAALVPEMQGHKSNEGNTQFRTRLRDLGSPISAEE